jgi:hypothetical protein
VIGPLLIYYRASYMSSVQKHARIENSCTILILFSYPIIIFFGRSLRKALKFEANKLWGFLSRNPLKDLGHEWHRK